MTPLGHTAMGLGRSPAVTAARRAAGAGSGCAAANGGKSVRGLGNCRLGVRQDQILIQAPPWWLAKTDGQRGRDGEIR